MEIEIVEDKENKLLGRRELRFKVTHDGKTPSREEVKGELKKIGTRPKGVVVIDGMRSGFGKRETLGYAKIYESEERAIEVERGHILVRNSILSDESS
jgi:small subunit ribosomal protein S24e